MHQGQSYIDNQVVTSAPGVPFSAIALTASRAVALRSALLVDAKDYLYSGAVSIGDAVQAVDRCLFSWATVKLYYSAFYLARALLALHGTAFIYSGTKGYSWRSIPGAVAVKRNGATHKAVLSTFAAVLPSNPLLSQPIDSIGALDWLIKLREAANYNNARFCEPNAPLHFEMHAANGIRAMVAAYSQDSEYLYTFDPEHAMLAFPIEALKQVLKQFSVGGHSGLLSAEDRKYLSSLYFDKSGPLATMTELFK